MAQIGEVSVAVKPDFSGFRRELNGFLRSLKDAEIKVDPQMDGFRQKVESFTSGMEANVQVNADTARAQARIAELARNHRATITIDVDESQLGKASKALGGLFGGGSGGGSLGGLGLAMGGLQPILIGAGVLAGLGPAIAVVSTGLAALPGLIAGVGIPMGLLAANAEGLKAAFSSLTPEWDALKASFMQGFNLEGNFGALILDPIRNLMNELSVSVSGIGTAMGSTLGQVIKGLTEGDGLAQIKTLFENIAVGILNAGPGIQDMVSGFLDLATAMTGKGMVDAFNDMAKHFKEFTSNPENIKLIQDAFTGLLDVIKQLSGDVLQMMVDGIKQMADPQFITNMKEMATGLGAVITMIADFGNFISRLKSPLDIFKEQLSWLGSIANYLAEKMTGVPGIIGAAFAAIPTIIGAVFSNIGSVISGAISSAISAVANFGSEVAAYMAAAWDGLTVIVQNAWDALVTAVGNGISTVIGVVSALPGQILGAIGDLGSLLIDSGMALMRGLASGITKGVQWAVGAARDALGAVRNLFPFSPAKEGPFSGTGYTTYSGQALIEGFAEGITNGKSAAVSSVTDVMKELNSVIDDSITEQQKKMQDAGTELGKGAFSMPFDFIDSISKTAMSDLGISGGGALGTAMDTGMGWLQDTASNFIFNVNNMDDAIQGMHRTQNTAKAGVVGR